MGCVFYLDFIVFYKDAPQPPSPPPSPGGPTDEERNKGKFRYFAAISEAFMRWTPYSFGGIEGFRIYAPMGTGIMYFWMPHYMVGSVGTPQPKRFSSPPKIRRAPRGLARLKLQV